jgi:hypothetical protein
MPDLTTKPDATHTLVCVQRAPVVFWFKYSKVNVKIPKHSPDHVNYTKYLCENINIPSLFFFVSSKVKFVFALDMDNKKLKKPLSSMPLIF